MKILNRRALTYVVTLSMISNPAFAAGLGELLSKGGTFLRQTLTGSGKTTVKNGAEVGATVSAHSAAEAVNSETIMGLRKALAFVDQLEKDTLGVFKNMQIRVSENVYSKTLGRDTELNNLINDLSDITSPGVALQGSENIGKGQLLVGLQEEINKGAVGQVLDNAKVIEVASNHAAFESISSLKTHFDKLAETVKGEEIIILHFNDIKPFIKDGASHVTLDNVIELAKRVLGKDRVKVVIRGNQDQIDLLTKSSELVASLRRQNIKELPGYMLDKIVSNYVKRVENESGVIFSTETNSRLIALARTYYSELGMPTAANTLASRVATFKNIQIARGDDLAAKFLTEKLASLEALENAAIQAVAGKTGGVAYARQLLDEIPEQKAEIKKLAETTLQHFHEMEQIRKELLAATPNANARFSVVIDEIHKEMAALGNDVSKFSDQLKDKIAKLEKLQTVKNNDIAMTIYYERNGTVTLEELLIEHRPNAESELLAEFQKYVYGQDHILIPLSEVAVNLRSQFRDTSRMLGKFSLNGDPGSAKTDLAKLTAKLVYGDENKIIRIDMSEYKDARSAGRFTGADPGLIGYDALTDLVSQANRLGGEGVILVDEVTRGNPEALATLLKLFEEATSTNTRGETANFSKFIAIFTSNVGEYGQHGLHVGSSADEIKTVFSEHYGLPSAMMDRIDNIFMTAPLKHEEGMKVLEKFIRSINERIKVRINKIELTPEVKSALLSMAEKEGTFPARNIRRMTDKIKTEIEHILDFGFYKNSKGETLELKTVPGDLIKVGWTEANGLVITVAK
ncbi:MAG: ATP-dependent Clp protease ATP-binding subunit [Bdellovibrionales bacterium]|nr:ATP-dependent Clp protease ATP-binding subunit [Bdellovibrionales bacterium]